MSPRGRVVLLGRLGVDGKLEDLQVIAKDDGRLVAPSLAAVKTWRYEPAKCDGTPVPVRFSVVLDLAPSYSQAKYLIRSAMPTPGGLNEAQAPNMALQRTRGLSAAQFLRFAGPSSAVQRPPGRRSPLNAVALGLRIRA